MRIEDGDLLKPWELKRRQYKQRAKLTGRREADTLARMRDFASALTAPAVAAADSPAARDAAAGGAQPSGAPATDEVGCRMLLRLHLKRQMRAGHESELQTGA